MTQDVATVSPTETLLQAAKNMVKRKVKSIVVTKGKKPIALLHEEDIIRSVFEHKKNPKTTKVSTVMHADYTIISPETRFFEVEAVIDENPEKKFLVVKNDEVVGIVTQTDVINATRDFTKYHYFLQEAILVLFGFSTAFFLFYFSPLGQALFRG